MSDPFRIDGGRVRRSFGRAAAGYDAAAVLQARVRSELLDRLDVVRLEPAVVLDLGAGTGHASLALKRRYRRSEVVALDLALGMLQQATRRQTLLRRFRRVCADAAALPLRTASADLVLRPGGLLSFATFGPDTLVELRRAWGAADGHAHVNRFIDMHDLGDALVRAGLAEPVLDVERYTLTYDSVRELMGDLKAIGAHNATAGRPRGLTGKGTLARMTAAYEEFRRDGRLPATYEVVYGQAWCPVGQRRDKGTPGEVTVAVDQIGRRQRGTGDIAEFLINAATMNPIARLSYDIS